MTGDKAVQRDQSLSERVPGCSLSWKANSAFLGAFQPPRNGLSRTILTQPGWQGVLGSWRLEYRMKTELVLDQGLDFVGYQLHWSQRPMRGICKTK